MNADLRTFSQCEAKMLSDFGGKDIGFLTEDEGVILCLNLFSAAILLGGQEGEVAKPHTRFGFIATFSNISAVIGKQAISEP